MITVKFSLFSKQLQQAAAGAAAATAAVAVTPNFSSAASD